MACKLKLITFSFFLFLNGFLNANIKDQKDDFLLKKVPILMQKYEVPGVALGLVRNGKLSCIECFGFADKDTHFTVKPDSIFQAASISKTVTAWGVVFLVQQGKLALDEPVEKHLRRWRILDASFPKEDVTVRRVLNHTAGLSEVSYGYEDYKSASYSLVGSLNGVSGVHAPLTLEFRPGENFLYTGGGYTLLQMLIEDLTEISFSNYMAHSLFFPLKLAHTSFNFPEDFENHICTPYDVLGESPAPLNFVEQAAAGLYTTIHDLTSFIVYALSSPLFMEMIDIKEDGYALGYEVEWLNPDMPLAYHLGANPGWRGGVFTLPSLNGGLVLLTNSDHGSDLVQDIANAWVEKETGKSAKFYQETLDDRYFMILINFLMLSILGYCFFKVILQLVRKKRYVNPMWWRVLPLTVVWVGIIFSWRLVFYNKISIGGGVWIISAYMPCGFHMLSISLYLLSALAILTSFTVRSVKQ